MARLLEIKDEDRCCFRVLFAGLCPYCMRRLFCGASESRLGRNSSNCRRSLCGRSLGIGCNGKVDHQRDYPGVSGMSSAAIVQKLWNYCNVLRDDGMSYGDWPALLMNASTASADPLLQHAFVLRARRSALRCTARVRLRASPLHAPVSRRGLALSPRTAMSNEGSIEQLTYLLFLKMADERTKPPYTSPARSPTSTVGPACSRRTATTCLCLSVRCPQTGAISPSQSMRAHRQAGSVRIERLSEP